MLQHLCQERACAASCQPVLQRALLASFPAQCHQYHSLSVTINAVLGSWRRLEEQTLGRWQERLWPLAPSPQLQRRGIFSPRAVWELAERLPCTACPAVTGTDPSCPGDLRCLGQRHCWQRLCSSCLHAALSLQSPCVSQQFLAMRKVSECI